MNEIAAIKGVVVEYFLHISKQFNHGPFVPTLL